MVEKLDTLAGGEPKECKNDTEDTSGAASAAGAMNDYALRIEKSFHDAARNFVNLAFLILRIVRKIRFNKVAEFHCTKPS